MTAVIPLLKTLLLYQQPYQVYDEEDLIKNHQIFIDGKHF